MGSMGRDMRGKPINDISAEDLQLLISDGVAEDRRIEFKVDIPVSAEMHKAYIKSGQHGRALDRGWISGKSISDYGRDALAEEIVAFANADGGTLIIGMDETKDAPPRASGINPLPDVAGLERRLKDIMNSCIEPRLPYLVVRAMPTSADGSGVVIIETSASSLGPHWVRNTRRPTVRRDDRCDPISMQELHEMVLRRAAGKQAVLRYVEKSREDFIASFGTYLKAKQKENRDFIGDDEKILDMWLNQTGTAALAAQVLVTPHYDLSLPRIETLDGLMPSDFALSFDVKPQSVSTSYVGVYTNLDGYSKRIMDGVSATEEGGFTKSIVVMRSGRVIVSFRQVRQKSLCGCHVDFIVGAAGFAMGVYDRLRSRHGQYNAPADIDIDICTRGEVRVAGYQGLAFPSEYGRLQPHVSFPSYTIGDTDDIAIAVGEIAADLMNAGGQSSANLPKLAWKDHI